VSDSFESLLRAVARAPEVDPQSLGADTDLSGRTLGRFRVIERLGHGGMGSVYRAFDEHLARDVALKVLRRDDGDAAALLREARSAAAVRHRAIAQIHDVGEADGVAFLAMERVDGETLRARIAAHGALPEDESTRIARVLAGALARAHATGLVHLDLKPDNVMIDRDGDVKVLDFGLARRAGVGERERGVVRGTPAYMAPEQADGRDVGPAADVFALGVTWQEMATGAPPSRVPRADLPKSIAPIVARCLAEDPAARFADGAAVATAIDRTRRHARGRRRLVQAAIGASVFVAVGLAAFTYVRRARPHPAPTAALRRLTANVPEVPIVHAALSPDGESLAYVDRAGLHVARLGSPDTRDLSAGPSGAPILVAWAPDGRSLHVATSGEHVGALARVPLDGAPPHAIAGGAFTGIAPSHDGARVAVAETRRVAWIDAAGARHPLVEKGPGCSITELAWSPDDARVAYTTLCFGTLGDATIESVAVSGGAPERITSDPRLFSDAARAGLLWSPRGDIVYPLAEWLPAESGSNLWSIPVDASGHPTSAPKTITSWIGTGARCGRSA
jgi:serine/threonine protein kinase